MNSTKTTAWLLVGAALILACQRDVVLFPRDGGPTCTASCGAGVTLCQDSCTCVSLVSDDGNCGACGRACGATESCAASACYADDCPGADCSADQVCVSDRCTDKLCVDKSCPAGQVCEAGVCKAATSCDAGVVCPSGQVCNAGACVVDMSSCDAGVSCPSGKVCQLGQCVTPMLECDAGTVEDANNCGGCGQACPALAHARRRCVTGVCLRGPCETGFYDVDGDVTPGCESTCVGVLCTLPDGGVVTLSALPLSELGSGNRAAGTSVGRPNNNSSYRHAGTLGEGPGTPTNSSNATHRNTGGLKSLQQ